MTKLSSPFSALRPLHLRVRTEPRFRVGRCCEYHWLSIQVGRHVWRWGR